MRNSGSTPTKKDVSTLIPEIDVTTGVRKGSDNSRAGEDVTTLTPEIEVTNPKIENDSTTLIL